MTPTLQSRIRGMLHGIALGDALGAPVEKLSAAQIRERYGRVTSVMTRWHKMDLPAAERNHRIRGDGIVTDDTLMTLALMDIYAETGRHLDAWDMADGMVRQIAWTPRWVPELDREAMLIDRLFYPEKWIFQRHQLSNCDPRQGGIGNMVNCGAAMYIAPIGVVNAADPRAAYDEAIAFAAGHQESYGLEAAGVMAAAVAAAFVPNTTVDAIVDTVLALAKDGTHAAIADIAETARRLRGQRDDNQAVYKAFHEVIGRYSVMGDDVNHRSDKAGRLSDAYRPSRLMAIEELPLALGFCLLNDGDFRTSIVDGINSGRDTDSIGVMAGAILGAMHGEAVIDSEDAAQIDRANRMALQASADAFADVARKIIAADRAASEARWVARAELGLA
ncbi:ADP-ribosylglycohydrolase family protein [Devosia aurantiaca]|uniref:ADP-ribosylglycohydrolase family protein n=1 Tax=Devosia aurantiaca TaxID=2714858 RepID=A0A6M1SUX6_9HYPH|nr:ADP-ribosylglycohydrolase family protein [Devosia aurantiaca]NGP19182.1 ADP-ribosylglycohydrolase family protein [Devosia aurantiaca]